MQFIVYIISLIVDGVMIVVLRQQKLLLSTILSYFAVALSTRNSPTFSWKKYSSKLFSFA